MRLLVSSIVILLLGLAALMAGPELIRTVHSAEQQEQYDMMERHLLCVGFLDGIASMAVAVSNTMGGTMETDALMDTFSIEARQFAEFEFTEQEYINAAAYLRFIYTKRGGYVMYPQSPEERKENGWTQITIKRYCLCPACFDEGKTIRLKQPRGSHYVCPSCGFQAKAVQEYRCPIDIQ